MPHHFAVRPQPRSSAPRRIIPALAALAVAAAVAVSPVLGASARGRAVQAWDGGRELTASAAGGSLRVELGPPGAATAAGELALPEGAVVGSAALLADGWAVAGSRPAAGAGGPGGRRLFFASGSAAGARDLPEPAGQRAPVRQDPVLLVDGGRLVGAAWLEGGPGGQLGVRAAAWDGERWGEPESVAAPGPGSQLALAGAVLDDGSWLLVWSAYDGSDDEIVWAQRTGGGWLPARRLAADNAVPDVVPAVAATAGGGAIAAWSRYDGREYRLRSARFAGGEWAGEEWAAPAGTMFPSFAGDRDRRWLVYRDAGARGWAVAELTAGGLGEPRIAAETSAERPAVVLGDGAPALVWTAAGEAPALRVEPRPAAAGGRER